MDLNLLRPNINQKFNEYLSNYDLINKYGIKNTNNIPKIKKIYLERKNIYKLADYKIKCNGLSKEDITDQIISIYEKY
jgi:hypothetical protein